LSKLLSRSKKWISVAVTAVMLLAMLTPLNASANTEPVSLVKWDFSNGNLNATSGIAENLDKTLSINGGPEIAASYVAGPTTGINVPNASKWTANPSFWKITLSTKGYENIKLSSKQKGSNTGPKDFKAQYSLDDTTWIDIPDAVITVANDEFISGVLADVSLPTEANNQDVVYVRWLKNSDVSINGGTVASTGTNRMGEIELKGTELTTTPDPQPEPTPVQGTLVLGEEPLANITFSFYHTTTNQWYDYTTDENGNFTYTLPNGTYKIDGVWVDPTWYVLAKNFTINNGLVDGQPLSIDALDYQIPTDGTANVIGTVQNGTEVFTYLPFSIHSTDGTWYDAKTDKNGQFAIELPDGQYQVDGIWNAEQGKWYELNQIFTVADGELQGSTELLIDIASVANDNVSGTLTKGSDALSNLTFSVRSASGDEKWYSATTDANGNYSLRLPDGDYLLEGIWNGSESKWYVLNKTFTVAGTIQLDINVYTDGPTDLTPNVTGVLKKGTVALPNVVFSVHTTSGEEKWYDISSDATGHFTTLLPDGSYMLEGIWLESEDKWYELKQEFTVDGAYELTIDVLAAQPPVGDVTAPTVARISNIDTDFSKNFSKMDQVNLTFSEEIAADSRAAIEAEIEGMTDLFGQGVIASWVGSGNNQLAITLFNDTFALTHDSSFAISKGNVSDVEGNHPQSDLIVEIPDYFSLTGSVMLPSDNPTTTSLMVRFGGDLHEDTKAITDVANIISNSRIKRIVNGTDIYVTVTDIQWNADYSALTLTIPETTFTNGERVLVSFLNVKDAHEERPLGGILGMIQFEGGTTPPPDTTELRVAYVSNSMVTIGRNVAASSTRDGFLYLVPNETPATYADLEATVQAGNGLKVSTTADRSTLLNTTDLPTGTYFIYAVDTEQNLSAPSNDIVLMGEPTSLEGTISFTVSVPATARPEPLDFTQVDIVPISEHGSNNSVYVESLTTPTENGVRIDISGIDTMFASTFYALINTHDYLLIEKFDAANVGVGAVKSVVVDNKYAAIQTTVSGLEVSYRDFITLNVPDNSGKAILHANVSQGTKVPYGTYHVQFTASRPNASYSLFKENFIVSATNSTLSFTEEQMAAVTINMNKQNDVNYVLKNAAALNSLGSSYNTIFNPNINEDVTTLILTKGHYDSINPRYIIDKNNEYWDITFFTDSVDLQANQTLTVNDQLAINVAWPAHIVDRKMAVDQRFYNYFSAFVQNDLGQRVEWFYKMSKTQWGYMREGEVNGKVTIKTDSKEYSKVINAFRFTDVTINEITGGEVLSGQVEIIFEVVDSPITITPYREVITIQ
jgi:hypothetical protein